jgi:4-hydroxy-2-oxoheptanedioate aldolase
LTEFSMRTSRIKAKISRNEPAMCFTITLASPEVFEMVSLMGFDGIWLDMEHHQHSVEMASQLMRAARVGTADIVCRPAKGEFMRMARMLEIGAQAIMYPRCDSPQEAAEVVRWAKFAPIGQRGFDGANADADYAGAAMSDYIEHANQNTLVIVQLEEQRAIDQADAIAAVPGVDAIMLGPADFSVLEGIPGEFDHPRVQNAIRTVAAAAKKAGKHWARTVSSASQAQQAVEQGARLLFQGADILFIRNGIEQLRKDYGQIGFCFSA